MKLTNLNTAILATLGATTAVPPTGVTPLRYEAQKKNITIGSGAINPNYLNDTVFAAVLTQQFNSLSPENELKWVEVNPSKGIYDWSGLDRLVAFAEANDMVVKGHGLISGCCNPDYVTNITDRATLNDAMTAHFTQVMHRYAGKMDRWDVVTEAFEVMNGTLAHNFFYNISGPGYIEDAFRIARAAAPNATLFINENQVEFYPEKRQGLYNLVADLVAKGVPIDGIALQMHETFFAPTPGVITEMVKSYHALGLEVTIAELDVHTLNNTAETEIYGAVIGEALEAGITDISFWGFTDKHSYTWIPGAQPLIFDANYTAKSDFYATHAALADFVDGC
jgi:GH35 family endo-1,4-beta-xylanase